MKPRENLIFLKNGKMVILVKIRNFSTKRTSPLEFFSQDLSTTSNFIEFQDSRNLHVFRDNEVWDTWCILSGSQCATCQVQIQST